MPNTSTVCSLELRHETHQRIDALFGERIVDGRPDPAHRPMALETIESSSCRVPDEPRFEFLGRQAEGDIHQGSAVSPRGATIELGLVNRRIELPPLSLISSGHGAEPTVGE